MDIPASEQIQKAMLLVLKKLQDCSIIRGGNNFIFEFDEYLSQNISELGFKEDEILNLVCKKYDFDITRKTDNAFVENLCLQDLSDGEVVEVPDIISVKIKPRTLNRAITQLEEALSSIENVNANRSFLVRESYNPNTGILKFCGKDIKIVQQKNRAGDKQKEPYQAIAMRLLFSNKSSFNGGVELRRVYTLRRNDFNKEFYKKVCNTLSEINKKIQDETGVEKLINWDKNKYYIDKQHRA